MSLAWTVVLAALGVDVGWQPLSSGGMEYIIQIEPDSLDSLLDGRDIISDVPTVLRDARSYRIRIGKDVLPQENPRPLVQGQPTPARPKVAGASRPPSAAPLSAEAGWQPLEEGGWEYIIQISQDSLASLLDGREIVSNVPNSLRDVRSCRIHLGQDPLPQKGFKSALTGEPTPAQPKVAAASSAATPDLLPGADSDLGKGPTLASPTVRGQGPDKSGETPAQARARRFREQNGSAPKRLDEESPADDSVPDYAADLSADPFSADGGHRVAQAQYRDDQPAPAGASKNKSSPTGSNKGSQFGNGAVQKPTRAALSDDDEPEDKKASKTGSKSRATAASTKSNSTKTAGSAERNSRAGGQDAGDAAADSKPWFPLTMALIALFASLGGNWYLGWMNWDLRNKCQQALNDRKWRREEYEPTSRMN